MADDKNQKGGSKSGHVLTPEDRSKGGKNSHGGHAAESGGKGGSKR